MIGWQNLAAFWALPLLALPVIVHLLRVHRADRVLFPSLRFVQPSRTAAVRLRMPSDLLLLALRLLIVGIVIAALASPVLVTPARVRRWNATTARVAIVDASASMHADGGTAVTQAREAARAETGTATYAHVVEASDLSTGLERAAAWLGAAPPARGEIVILSDFQRGALTQEAIVRVPGSIGLRLVPIGQPSAHQIVRGDDTLGAPGIAPRRQTIALTPESTTVTFTSDDPLPAHGVRFVNALPAEETALLRTLAHVGTPAGSADQPIAFVFGAGPDAAALQGLAPIRDRWMLRTVWRLTEDPAWGQTGVRPGSDRGQTRVRPGSDSKAELVLGIAAPAGSFAAASLVRAALVARRSVDDYAEHEIARMSDATLVAWNRPSAPVGPDAWRTAESTDARWCWLIALVLLGLEHWLRTRQPIRRSQEVTRAAA